MTPDQELEAKRLDCYLARESLVPILNDTKWRRLIKCIAEVQDYSVRFRVKCLRNTESDVDYWDGSFPWHVPTPYKSIEWIDFNPVSETRVGQLLDPHVRDFTDEICAILDSITIPYEIENFAIRVYGYKRPTQQDA